jgi:CBS domain-containing protein
MLLKEIMTPDVETIEAGASVKDAASIMKGAEIGMLPVTDQGQLIGIVTDRDITVMATADGSDPRATPVRDVMTPDLVFAYEDDRIEDGAQIMADKEIRRLLILNKEKKLAGIVSVGDLAAETGDLRLVASVLEHSSVSGRIRRKPKEITSL